MNGDRLTTLVGFAAAILILVVVVWVVGIDDVLTELARADPRLLVFVLLAAAVWLSFWGLSLWTVLRAVGAPVRPHVAILTFTAAMFSNNVTPFGQAGGEPVSALLIASVSDSDYETGLASIASVDTLHFVPSIALATAGFGYIVLSSVQLTQNLYFGAAAVAALALAVPVLAYVGWRHRYRIEQGALRVFTPLAQTIGQAVPRLSPPDPGSIERRIEGFFETVSRVARDRRALVLAMGFSTLGWLALAAALWLSLSALGYVVAFPVVLFVVPVGSIAGVTPLPGGFGSLDTATAALLVPTAGISASMAFAAVVIYRAATYLLPTAFGGVVAAVIGARGRRS